MPEIRVLTAQPTAVVRRNVAAGGVADALGEIFPAVLAHLQAARTAPAGPPFARHLAVSDDRAELLEAGMPTTAPVPGDGPVEASELPAGEALVVRHVGPYDQVGAAYAEAERWCAAEGRAQGGAPWESYLTDPGQEPDPSRWVTEVTVPLAPR